jgi:L-threonylcarbamoyladenylate synthase
LRLTKAEEELARKFWPGPLSIVAEVDPRVSPLAKDHTGRSAVRMSPHVIAARLCHEAGAPLVSSSANRSGLPPVCRPDELDSELVRDSGALVIASTPWPGGGLPSTLVKIAGTESVRILRAGAISTREIIAAGVEVLS